MEILSRRLCFLYIGVLAMLLGMHSIWVLVICQVMNQRALTSMVGKIGKGMHGSRASGIVFLKLPERYHECIDIHIMSACTE